jgi:hypothetical protein
MNCKKLAAIILLGSLICGSLTLFSLFYVLNSWIMPPQSPDIVKHFTIQLPNGIKVQVEKTISYSWDDNRYEYKFTHAGKPIASSWEWNSPERIKTGRAGNIAYLFQRKLICIYANSRWVTWDTGDESLAAWWKSFEKASGQQHGSLRPDDSGDFGIETFLVKGKVWTVRLHTRTEYGDWSGGLVPQYIHVDSNNRGQSWRVRERIVEKHKRLTSKR